jgi:uncharacterized membrane protein YcaP (DUF421 family)
MSGALLHVAVHAAVAYAVLLGLVRASGKRTVTQGTPFDFVLALVLGDMVDDLLWGDVSLLRFLVAVGTLTLVHSLVAWAQSRSPLLAGVVSGRPRVLMSDGQPVQNGLRAEHVAESELEELLRVCGVPRPQWPDVETALLETSGAPSVAKHTWAEPASRGEVGG